VARCLLLAPAIVSSSIPSQTGRSIVVALFEQESQARRAVEAVRALGVAEQQVGLLAPVKDSGSSAASPSADVSGLLALAARAGDTGSVLQTMGVPDGDARFYAQGVQGGRTLVVVKADSEFAGAREVLLQHGGYDVQSQGGELARPEGAGVPGGTGPRPIDVTGHWQDVASRYEMLWQQHFGTSDATWEQLAPVYRHAWQAANDARYRGRPWSEVEAALRQDWQSSPATNMSWSEVAGPVRDVWEDVAEEAAMGAEGGADRRVPRPGADQSVAARNLSPPS
jgi:hypothetical protein